MSDKPIPRIPDGVLTEEQVAKIGGGDCTAAEYAGMLEQLRDSYDTLIDFTSYVMERVIGP